MNFKKSILLVVLIAMSCAKAKTALLSDRVEAFNESLRWSSIKAASELMDDHNKRTLIDRYAKEFQKNSIVEYSILDIGFSPSKETGTVLIEFSFYNNSTQDLSYKQEIQTWDFDATRHNWVMKEARTVSKKDQ